ncbi:hypothetical protein MKX03_007904 [Papaver bracteatum]|nr:hypothetical protein MKX03_007904 [Papaver bracteatum]
MSKFWLSPNLFEKSCDFVSCAILLQIIEEECKPNRGCVGVVSVPPHSLIKQWVYVLRNERTPPPVFKNAMAELGRLLIYEASRDWLVSLICVNLRI